MFDNLCRGEEIIYKTRYQGTLHLLASDGMDLCLDASPRKRLTSKDFAGASFSPCKGDANQVLFFVNLQIREVECAIKTKGRKHS